MRGLRNSWVGDLAIRLALGDQAGDLMLLRCELVQGRGIALAGGLSGCAQLGRGTLLPQDGAERAEQLKRGAEMEAGVLAPAFATEPFAVEQLGAAARHGRYRLGVGERGA